MKPVTSPVPVVVAIVMLVAVGAMLGLQGALTLISAKSSTAAAVQRAAAQ
jgi:hypothetical protein